MFSKETEFNMKNSPVFSTVGVQDALWRRVRHAYGVISFISSFGRSVFDLTTNQSMLTVNMHAYAHLSLYPFPPPLSSSISFLSLFLLCFFLLSFFYSSSFFTSSALSLWSPSWLTNNSQSIIIPLSLSHTHTHTLVLFIHKSHDSHLSSSLSPFLSPSCILSQV